jgi:hypothetical protein
VEFNVTVNNVTFDNIGGDDMNLDAFTTENVTAPDVTLQEAISITNVTSTDGNGRGLFLQNTHAAGTANIVNYTSTDAMAADGRLRFDTTSGDVTLNNVTVTGGAGFALDFATVESTSAVSVNNFTYDGLAGAAGGIRMDTYDGTFTIQNSSLTNGLLAGVSILNESDGTFTFQSTTMIDSVDGTAFLVDGGGTDQFTGVVSVSSAIMNDTGRSVSVSNISGAGTSVTFTGNVTDTGEGIRVDSNVGGTILFSGTLDLDTGANSAILATNNTGADINFGGRMEITTTSGSAFTATGGGTLTASNTTNTIATTTGRAVNIQDMTISNVGVNLSEINRSASAGTEAILLEDNTGGPVVLGTLGDDPGESGVIAGGTVDAIVVRNSSNTTISALQVDNTNAVSGVRIEKTSGNTAMTVNLNDLEINAGDIGIDVVGGATGNLIMTVNDSELLSSTATGLGFDNVDAGTIQVNAVTIDGNSAAATAGARILNSDASFTFDSATLIREIDGVDLLVDGGAPTVSFSGDIVNSSAANAGDTLGRSVVVQNVTGGTTTLAAASSINDDNLGVLITNNTGGTTTFLGTYDLSTGGADAVTITNNTGATISLSGLDIDTTSGNGFVATGGGTLTVLGSTNTIDTTTGVGLRIEDMTIGASGVAFQSVNVTNGSTNGIVLEDLTGPGQVSIGNLGGAADSGGTLTTTNEAIVLRNVQNVDLRNIRVASAGNNNVLVEHTAGSTSTMDVTINGLNLDATTGTGVRVSGANNTNTFNLRVTDSDLENDVDMDITGSGTFALLMDNNDINTTGTDVAFSLAFSGSALSGQVTLTNGNNFTSDDASALSITGSGGSAKTINLLVDGSTSSNSFTNNSTDAAADFLISGSTTLNATIRGNIFDDANAGGSDFTMTGTGASARIRLSLGGDDVADFNTAAGVGEFNLVEAAGADFDVFERDNTFADLRNNGLVIPNPNAGAFDNLPAAPPLPIGP